MSTWPYAKKCESRNCTRDATEYYKSKRFCADCLKEEKYRERGLSSRRLPPQSPPEPQ